MKYLKRTISLVPNRMELLLEGSKSKIGGRAETKRKSKKKKQKKSEGQAKTEEEEGKKAGRRKPGRMPGKGVCHRCAPVTQGRMR